MSNYVFLNYYIVIREGLGKNTAILVVLLKLVVNSFEVIGCLLPKELLALGSRFSSIILCSVAVLT